MPTSTITGLDVGTSKVASCIGQKRETGLDIIGVGLAPCAGLRKGMVVDIEETISAISASLEQAERMAGVPVEDAFVGIGGAHITSSNSKGVIAVSRADGEISSEDTDRVVEAARAISMPTNREILHVIPRFYIVDGQEGIKDPVGMTGIRLEVETHVIGGSTPVIKNLTKCVYQAGVEIDDLVFNGLATASAYLSKKQKEIGVVLADIGAGTTELTVFEEGTILHSAVLPVGSAHITNDIAIGLRTSIDTAEQIKLEYGLAKSERVEDEEIDLSKIDPQEESKASLKYIAEIIEARFSEIFNLIGEELKGIGREATLPGGIILVGGGAKIDGVVDVAKETLKIPAQVGTPVIKATGMIDKLQDPVYAVSVGVLNWGFAAVEKGTGEVGGLKKATSGIKKFFKNFIP